MVSDRIQRAITTKDKIGKLDFVKIKIFWGRV